MKKINSFFIAALISFLVISLNSCAAIAGIFKAGVWTGIILVVIVVAVIIWIISRITRK